MMNSAALLADNAYTAARSTRAMLDRYIPTEGSRTRKPKKVEVIETGLAPDLRVETAVPADPMLIGALVRMHELKALRRNWDGYGAKAVDVRVFRSALELVIDSVKRCQAPTLLALSDGGLGLRWDDAGKSLEIDISPNGLVEALLDGDAVGEAREFEGGTTEQALAFLCDYCRA